MGDELSIETSVDKDTATLTLSGNISTISSPYLEDEFKNLGADIANINLDISNIDYISEAGFDLMLKMQEVLHAKGGHLKILHPNDLLLDMMNDLGIKDAYEVVE